MVSLHKIFFICWCQQQISLWVKENIWRLNVCNIKAEHTRTSIWSQPTRLQCKLTNEITQHCCPRKTSTFARRVPLQTAANIPSSELKVFQKNFFQHSMMGVGKGTDRWSVKEIKDFYDCRQSSHIIAFTYSLHTHHKHLVIHVSSFPSHLGP